MQRPPGLSQLRMLGEETPMQKELFSHSSRDASGEAGDIRMLEAETLVEKKLITVSCVARSAQ